MVRSTVAALLLAGVSGLASGALADNTATISLAGVQLRNATNQSRSSAPDTIDPGCTYTYSINGMVRGAGGFTLLAIRYPTPTPLAQVLEDLAPGSSAFLNGTVSSSNGGVHPIQLSETVFDSEQVIAGVTVRFGATISVGINASNIASFTIRNVTISPASVGYLEFTSGTAVITSTPACGSDFNRDCFVDFFDYDDFVQCFEGAGCPAGRSADFNGDDFVDFFDYDAFVSAFERGC
jgi:hypothetical protein